MSARIPVLAVGDLLLVTIQTELDDRAALALRADLTDAIAERAARGVLIDISSVEVIDSFIGRVLADIAEMARLLGAHTVVVGMRPPVAMTLVDLGLTLDSVATALDVERGMRWLRAQTDRA